jgi:flagellar biosynthesis protein FliQ
MIIFTYWAAVMLHGSPLLACMALGGVLVNIYNNIDDIVRVSEAFNPPILMLFFVISGAGFQVSP